MLPATLERLRQQRQQESNMQYSPSNTSLRAVNKPMPSTGSYLEPKTTVIHHDPQEEEEKQKKNRRDLIIKTAILLGILVFTVSITIVILWGAGVAFRSTTCPAATFSIPSNAPNATSLLELSKSSVFKSMLLQQYKDPSSESDITIQALWEYQSELSNENLEALEMVYVLENPLTLLTLDHGKVPMDALLNKNLRINLTDLYTYNNIADKQQLCLHLVHKTERYASNCLPYVRSLPVVERDWFILDVPNLKASVENSAWNTSLVAHKSAMNMVFAGQRIPVVSGPASALYSITFRSDHTNADNEPLWTAWNALGNIETQLTDMSNPQIKSAWTSNQQTIAELKSSKKLVLNVPQGFSTANNALYCLSVRFISDVGYRKEIDCLVFIKYDTKSPSIGGMAVDSRTLAQSTLTTSSTLLLRQTSAIDSATTVFVFRYKLSAINCASGTNALIQATPTNTFTLESYCTSRFCTYNLPFIASEGVYNKGTYSMLIEVTNAGGAKNLVCRDAVLQVT